MERREVFMKEGPLLPAYGMADRGSRIAACSECSRVSTETIVATAEW